MQQHLQRIETRGQVSPDARPLKRHHRGHRQSGGGAEKAMTSSGFLHPDVYPQQERQEEDNMSADKVTSGYKIEVIHRSLVAHEYDTVMKIPNYARFLASDDHLARAAALIKQIVGKKNELNIVLLDKNWFKENTLRSLKEGIRQEFFECLATGRRLQVKDKRLSLQASFPQFQRASPDRLVSLNPQVQKTPFPLCEAMDLLYEKGVPIHRAIWFFKMNQIAHPILATNKPKKAAMIMPSDDYASDQRQFFVRYLRCMLKEFDKAIPGQLEQNTYYQRWPYVASLIKHSFEDGMLDRHEFLLDMCELLAEFSNYIMEQPQTFRVLLILVSQFIDVITQSVFISRRIFHVLCARLNQYRRDHERIRSSNSTSPTPSPISPVTAQECFQELASCQHHRPTVLTIFGFLHAIIIDCPSALVWTPLRPQDIVEGLHQSSKFKTDKNAAGNHAKQAERETAQNGVAWLCNSPLDHLPCPLTVTTQHLSQNARADIDQLLASRTEEIAHRSRAIESRWALINPSNAQSGLESIVETCLNILSFLDTINLEEPDVLLNLYNNIFNDECTTDMGIIVRVLVQWAVSAEREGTHRALLVARLLRMHACNSRDARKSQPFGNAHGKLQELLVDCLNRDWAQPTGKAATDPNIRATEFGNLMQLFYELQRHELFSHDKYVKALMRTGTFDTQGLFLRLNLANLTVAVGSDNGNNNIKSTENNNESRQQPTGGPNSVADTSGSQQLQIVPSTEPQSIVVKQEPQMIISFIPTTTTKPTTTATIPAPPPALAPSSTLTSPMVENQSATTSHSQKQSLDEFAKLPPEYENDQHPYLGETPEISFHERFIIHLPVEQLETNRDVCNQRAIVLYGITDQRDTAKQELRKLAREICRIWKRMTIELTATAIQSDASGITDAPIKTAFMCDIRFKRRSTLEQMAELMARFRTQTYYDQLVISGWCAESFVDAMEDFVRQLQESTQKQNTGKEQQQPQQQQQNISLTLPSPECLDMLCTMMTVCRCVNSVVTLADELVPFLVQLECLLRDHQHHLQNDVIPGSICAQYAYVLVAHLAEHFWYFLYSPEACTILNDLYRLVEHELVLVCTNTTASTSARSKYSNNIAMTGWARAVAVFVYHAKHTVLGANLNIVHGIGPNNDELVQMLGRCEEFEAVFPASGAGSVANNLRYQPDLLGNSLPHMSPNELRFYSLKNYKRLTHILRDGNARYSFVVDAFKAAVSYGRDYDRLVELANFCAGISVSVGMTMEWCNAIQELCYPSASSDDWKELIQDIDATKFSTHYPIATFSLLLASKYCFSTHGLLCRLMAKVLYPLLAKQEASTENTTLTHRKADDFGGHDNNFCLTLYICACLVCGTDEPFQYCDNSSKTSSSSTNSTPTSCISFNRDANKLALRIVHLVELDTSIFPLLSVIVQLVDGLKRKVEARKESVNFRTITLSQHYCVARCALLSMCEQEWVVRKMFALCDAHPELEMFTQQERLRNHYVGQQLLRLALRRRSERAIKQELLEHTGDKRVYERLLSALSVWNMRATYYDFKLNILEQNPDSPNGNQQLASSYQMAMYQQALFNNMATACHQLFKEHLLLLGNNRSGSRQQREELTDVQHFRLSAINCFWLIAPLVNAMPSPPPPTTGNPQNTLWCPWNSSAMKAYLLKVVADNLSINNNNVTDGIAAHYEQLLGYQPFLNLVLTCTDGEDIKQLLDSLLNHIEDIIKRVKKNSVVPYQTSFLPERDALILRLNLISGLFDNLLANNNIDLWASALFQLLYYEVFTYERDRDYFVTCYDMLLLLCHRIYPHKMYTNFIGKFKNLRIPDELHALQQLLPVAKSQAELTAWDSFNNLSPHKAIPPMGGAAGTAGGGKPGAAQFAQQQQPMLPVSKPQIAGIVLDKQPPSVQKQLLRLLRHEHWMVKQSTQDGKLVITVIPRPGLPGGVDMRPDPFLAGPEMEQVAVLRLEEPEMQPQQQQQQQMLVQQQQQLQAVQQQQKQQQPSGSDQQRQQFKMEPENVQQQQIRMAQQQQIKLEQQQQQSQQQHQQMLAHQQQMQQNMLAAQQQQQQTQPPQTFQQMFQQQQPQQHQPMMAAPIGGFEGVLPGPSSMIGGQPPQSQQFVAAQQPMISMLQQARGSGSSTPTGTDSPKTGVGRGGRRKSGAGAGGQAGANTAAATGAGRGQKRKKAAAAAQSQQPASQPMPQQLAQQPLPQQPPGMANVSGMEMYGGGGGMGPGPTMTQAAAIMMQQQQQWQQMQRQQQGQQQQRPMMGNTMMYPPQQQQPQPAGMVAAHPHFRPQQQPQQVRAIPVQQQQQQQMPSQTQHFAAQHQMMQQQGMILPPPQMPLQQHSQQQDPSKSNADSRSVIQQRLMQRVQQNQQNQQAQQQQQPQQHSMGMGGGGGGMM